MRFTRVNARATVGLCGLTLSFLLLVDASALDQVANTRIDVHNDGVSVVFTAHSSDTLLSLTVRVAGPDGRIVFDRRTEAPMVEWVPDSNLTNGRYTWEARAVTVEPGAPQRPSSRHHGPEGNATGRTGTKADATSPTVPIERSYADRHKQVTRTHGHLRARRGQLEALPSAPEALSPSERALSAVLRWLVPPAHATKTFNEDVTIETSTPDLHFNDTEGSAWTIRGDDNHFAVHGGLTMPLEIALGAPDTAFHMNQFGWIGLGTLPSGPFHIADTVPGIVFEDTNGAHSWQLQPNELGYRVRDKSAGTTPFQIKPGAPTNSLRVSDKGRIGIGTATPRADLHIVGRSGPTGEQWPWLRFEEPFNDQEWRVWGAGEPFGFRVEDITSGNLEGPVPSPLVIQPGTQHAALWMEGQRIGVGTDDPAAPLHVRRSNGTAKVLVDESSSTPATRELFILRNNGAPFFIFENTDLSESYSFAMGATGHFMISHQQTSGVQMRLRPNGDMTITGTLVEGSSRALKDGMVAVDPGAVLAKVDALPISKWHYTGNGSNRHMGPMAEDFYATFGLGPDNQHIAPKDLAGVSLAAIKALKSENEILRAETMALKAQSERLRTSLKNRLAGRDQRIARLEERVQIMEQAIGRVSGSDDGSVESAEHSPR